MVNECEGGFMHIDADFIHDLNNLLALISQNSELGLMIEDMPREDMLRLLSQVHAAARTAIDLVACYQSLADPDENFDLRDLVFRTADAVSKGIVHRVLVTVPERPVLTYGDPEPLMRVLLNLSDNACNAAGDTGQVALSLALASEKSGEVTLAIGHQPDPPFAILTVTDTGPGIPEGLLGQIWERGFSTKGQPGSGQGLALVQNRIERAGAGLAVETHFGVGTTFRVFWPLQAKDVGENLEAR